MMVVDNSAEAGNTDVNKSRLATQVSAESEALRLKEKRALIHWFDILTAVRGRAWISIPVI
jgi:hypothetical protein